MGGMTLSKPGTAADIPDDIWKSAYNAFRDGFGLRYEVAVEYTARAIYSERKRCAAICDARAKEFWVRGVVEQACYRNASAEIMRNPI